MQPTVLPAADWPSEEGTLVLAGAFSDDADASVTPSSVTWTLTDENGAIINSRSAVALTPATTYQIVLTGDDLAIGSNSPHRRVLIAWRYDSDAGVGLYGKHEIQFQIINLTAVT